MKTLRWFAAILFTFCLSAQAQIHWVGDFFGDGSGETNLLANDGFGVASTNYVNNALAGVPQFMFFSSTTNNDPNFTRTNNYQGWTAVPSTITTQSYPVTVVGAYVRQVVSTQTVSVIPSGPMSCRSYVYRTGGGGTASIHYEVYVWDTVAHLLIQLASSSPQTVVAGSVNTLDFSMSSPLTFIASNATKIVVSVKLDSIGTGAVVLHFINGADPVTGTAYDAHANFTQPLSAVTIQGSQVQGAVGSATNAVNSTNYWGTLVQSNLTLVTLTNSVSGSVPFTVRGSVVNTAVSTASTTYFLPPDSGMAIGAVASAEIFAETYFVTPLNGGWVSNVWIGVICTNGVRGMGNAGTNVTIGIWTNGVEVNTTVYTFVTGVATNWTFPVGYQFQLTNGSTWALSIYPNVALPGNTRWAWAIPVYPY